MNQRFKELMRDFLPPIYKKLLKKISPYGYFGNYKTWEEAAKRSSGYDSDIILEKCKNSLLKVRDGKAVYERDSILFDQIEYSWPVLAGLLWIASQNNNRLSLIDFGGSLGSSYFQNRKFLQHLDLKWSIIEQEKFVESGKKYFANEQLNFYYDIQECLAAQKPDTILFSTVLEYLETPFILLKEIIKKGFKYIIFDRTIILESHPTRLTVQKVPPSIYTASYPCWIFNRTELLQIITNKYNLIVEFPAYVGTPVDLGLATANYKGFIFQMKS